MPRLQSKPHATKPDWGEGIAAEHRRPPLLCLQDHRSVHCCPLPALPQAPIELCCGPCHRQNLIPSPPNWQTSANGSAPVLQGRLGKREAGAFSFYNSR